MNIFPDQNLSATEMTIVAEALTQLAVRKYLHILAYNVGRDIVMGTKASTQTAEDYLLLEATLKGQLAAIDTLLSVEVAAPAAQ